MKSLPNSIDLPDTAYRLPGPGLYRPAVMANNVTNLRKIPRELFKNRRGTALLEKIFCSIGGCEEAGHCQGINNDHRSVESPPCDHMYKACAGLSKTPAIRLFGESLVETLSQTSCEDAGRQALLMLYHNWRSLNPFVLLIVLGQSPLPIVFSCASATYCVDT
ncbi:hypothetical protein LI328DRAFT_165545 [Trichoderma asperelloides]|nr:hypothetical protein LI328DRAFT_165545 [Trichoderma asperelloides]